jgi:hypothetical protein
MTSPAIKKNDVISGLGVITDEQTIMGNARHSPTSQLCACVQPFSSFSCVRMDITGDDLHHAPDITHLQTIMGRLKRSSPSQLTTLSICFVCISNCRKLKTLLWTKLQWHNLHIKFHIKFHENPFICYQDIRPKLVRKHTDRWQHN